MACNLSIGPKRLQGPTYNMYAHLLSLTFPYSSKLVGLQIVNSKVHIVKGVRLWCYGPMSDDGAPLRPCFTVLRMALITLQTFGTQTRHANCPCLPEITSSFSKPAKVAFLLHHFNLHWTDIKL